MSWAGFEDESRLFAPELDPESQSVIEAARDQLRHHFGSRADEERRRQLEEWKTEKVYPFTEEPETPTEVAERELFEGGRRYRPRCRECQRHAGATPIPSSPA